MRVLVATKELQGTVAGDYCRAVEGELVVAVTPCASAHRQDCGRGFPGLASHRSTTTALIVDLPHVGPDQLRDALRGHVERAWRDLLEAEVADDEPDPDAAVEQIMDELVDDHVDGIARACHDHPCGTVVQRDGATITVRSFPAAA